jgi:hypothetical protein
MEAVEVVGRWVVGLLLHVTTSLHPLPTLLLSPKYTYPLLTFSSTYLNRRMNSAHIGGDRTGGCGKFILQQWGRGDSKH